MLLRIISFCLIGGLPLMLADVNHSAPLQTWLAGIFLAACFLPVALFGPKSFLRQFAIIGTALLFVTAFCTWTEAMFFLPSAFKGHPWQALFGSIFLYTVIAVLLAALAHFLKLHREAERTVVAASALKLPLLIVAAGVAYAIYYFIFGAITFQFFTSKYYPEAAAQARSWGLWFWALQIGRGILMTLAILPALFTLRLSRTCIAVAAGMIVWVAGGLAPLLIPNDFMSPTQRFIHIIEILTQNFSLGFTAAFLLTRNKQTAMPAKAGI